MSSPTSGTGWTEAPHQLVVHAEVSVDEPVAHPSHASPLQVGELSPGLLGPLLRGLADDLQAADERPPQSVILKELLRGQAPGTVIEVLGLVQNVLEELTPRERHARPR